MMMPVMSLAVVTNGPDAMAGSTPNFFMAAGAMVPMDAAAVMAATMATNTTTPSMYLPPEKKMMLMMPTTRPQTAPINMPTRNSRNSTVDSSATLTRPVARPRVRMVADCVPTLPPMAVMTGTNDAS